PRWIPLAAGAPLRSRRQRRGLRGAAALAAADHALAPLAQRTRRSRRAPEAPQHPRGHALLRPIGRRHAPPRGGSRRGASVALSRPLPGRLGKILAALPYAAILRPRGRRREAPCTSSGSWSLSWPPPRWSPGRRSCTVGCGTTPCGLSTKPTTARAKAASRP